MPIGSTVSDAIASLANADGATIIEHTRAPLVRGRVGIPSVTLTAVTEVVHAPDPDAANRPTAAGVADDERVVFYFRTEVLPARTDPGGNEPWWIVIDDRTFQIERVEDWQAGGFWAAHGVRVRQWRTVERVWFASVVDDVVAPFDGLSGYASSRACRVSFDVEEGATAITLAIPTTMVGPSDAISFKGVAGSQTNAVTPLDVATETHEGVDFYVYTFDATDGLVVGVDSRANLEVL